MQVAQRKRSDSDLAGLAKSAAVTMGFHCVDKALGLVLTVLAPKVVGLDAFGAFSVCTSVFYLLANVADAGLSDAVVREGSNLADRRAWGALAGLRRFVLVFPLALSAGLALALWAAAPAMAAVFGARPDLPQAFRFMALGLPFWVLSTVLVQFSVSQRVVRHLAVIKLMGEPLLKIVFFLPLAWLGWTLPALTGGFALAMAACCLWAALAGLALWRRLPRAPAEPVAPLPLLAGSVPLLGPRLLTVGVLWADTILLGALTRDNVQIGLYCVALKIVVVPDIIPRAFTGAVSPRLASLWQAADRRELVRLYQRAGRWMASFSLPLLLFLTLRADLCMSALGAEFRSGGDLLAILCLGPLAVAFLGPAQPLLTMTGRSRSLLAASVLSAALNLGGCALFIPSGGARAAAWVLGATFLAFPLLCALAALPVLRRPPVSLRCLALIPALAPVTAGLLVLRQHPLLDNPRLECLLEGPLFLVLALLSLFSLTTDAQDRNTLHDAWRRTRGHVKEILTRPAERKFR